MILSGMHDRRITQEMVVHDGLRLGRAGRGQQGSGELTSGWNTAQRSSSGSSSGSSGGRSGGGSLGRQRQDRAGRQAGRRAGARLVVPVLPPLLRLQRERLGAAHVHVAPQLVPAGSGRQGAGKEARPGSVCGSRRQRLRQQELGGIAAAARGSASRAHRPTTSAAFAGPNAPPSQLSGCRIGSGWAKQWARRPTASAASLVLP